ncbi:glycosyltransferase [Romboutsia maritimum]|uniref:Glycosyltransferase n=1 Tax=Romboutsia maritimum TaxID=2020948 RepID=A0A371IVM5_9FIRM|nr:glycosyltransferase [Romboutsia maritimum]RDY24509.1 glycosyltransferase [Romboutsia maritimum]
MLNEIANMLNQNELEKALNLMLENEELYINDVEFINMKAILCIKVGEYKAAISNLEAALNIDYFNLDTNYNLAYAYEQLGDIEKSIDIYKKIFMIAEDDAEKQAVLNIINSDYYTEKIKDFMAKLLEVNDLKKLLMFIDNNIIILENMDFNDLNKEILSIYDEDKITPGFNYGEVKIIDTILKKHPEMPKNIFESRSNLKKIDERPLVSIFILSYNKLEEYTKKCVESVLKYTKEIDYELVLVDNGSTDGTYEYFKSINYEKKKIIKITKNMGVGYPVCEIFNEVRGKYVVALANDIVVTTNWLSNMVKCAQSDEKIGMVNPVLDFVSNYQSVDLGYTDLDDMQKKAAKYNVSDFRKWHERLKLITLGTLFKKECIDVIGITDYGFIHHYADDDITFRVRRAGYKAILCKDTFISHIGKLSDKGNEVENVGMTKGDEFFIDKYYGIKSTDAMNYECNMVSLLDEDLLEDKNYKILGIDTLCGTPILEVKNKLRENGILNTSLYAFSVDAKYWLDLNTICKKVVVDRVEYITEHFNQKFDYIVIGSYLNLYKEPYQLLRNLFNMLNDDGSILLKLKNNYDIKTFLHMLNLYEDFDKQGINNICIKTLNKVLNEIGYQIEDIKGEEVNISNDIRYKINEMLGDIDQSGNSISNLYVDTYVLKIKKLTK